MIEKFKREDGYYSEDDCHYETAEDFIQCEIFGFCGCGRPDDNLKYIMDGLAHIDSPRQYERESFSDWYEQWVKEGLVIFGNEVSRHFFFYWADKEELTEHGGSVPGWLTEKGRSLLEDLKKEYPVESPANNGLQPTPKGAV